MRRWVLGLALLAGCGANAPRVEVHTGKCGEPFSLPLVMNLQGCAAVQGVYLVPVGLTVEQVAGVPKDACIGNAKYFPRAGDREGMIRFARFCFTNQTEPSSDVFLLTGTIREDGLAMPGYFEIAKDDGLATGIPERCRAEIPTAVFRCTE